MAILVVDHLILVPNCLAAFFEDEIFQAVVRALRDFPFPGEIKFGESFLTNNVAGFAARFELKFAILNGPSLFRESLFAETAPAFRGFAVEEQFPSGLLLIRRKRV